MTQISQKFLENLGLIKAILGDEYKIFIMDHPRHTYVGLFQKTINGKEHSVFVKPGEVKNIAPAALAAAIEKRAGQMAAGKK